MEIDIFDTDMRYEIIYTDPPWQQGKGGKKKVRPNSSGGELEYPTMNLQEIQDIHKLVSEKLVNKNHNIFMWTINKYLIDAQKIMEELGYTLHARIVWNKTTGMCPAYTVRFQTEYLLWFYKKGYMLKTSDETRGKYPDIMTESVKKHSKKPECAYDMLEDMFPDAKKLELFSRNTRIGWDAWGNQVGLLNRNLEQE